ncbi:MAG: tRNA dihydrouridine synthase DusB [Deltaproteobacteria bacterium]|nr:MAG: tRNA dihydrouridine synthase DusB [Deltaproteobacteria bacterium]
MIMVSGRANWQTPAGNASAGARGLIRPLRIGNVETRTNLLLAPMSGVTDCAFRCLVLACSGPAVGMVVSEFVAAEGLTRANARTLEMLRYKEEERPISIQIFGSEPWRMAEAARIVEAAGADIVDINCGCPAPKVVRRGGGAELMRQAPRLSRILRAVRRAVRIPVTVKIRAGWDADHVNALEIGRVVELEGAAMLAVHGRTRVQMYRGAPDWDLVARLREELSIPVIGSGDVRTPAEALAHLRAGHCDGVMIGRAAMRNPWIFAQAVALAEGRSAEPAGAEERVWALAEFRRRLEETLPERALMGRLRGMACRLGRGLPGSAAVREAIGRAPTADEVERIFRSFVLSVARPQRAALPAEDLHRANPSGAGA